nr:ADAMTS-like protein 3 [Kogia breviceps]
MPKAEDGTEIKKTSPPSPAPKHKIMPEEFKADGIYGCSVANHLSSDVESSSVLYAKAPVILAIGRNITRPEHSHLSVVIGGIVEAPQRPNVTIQCPVKDSRSTHMSTNDPILLDITNY